MSSRPSALPGPRAARGAAPLRAAVVAALASVAATLLAPPTARAQAGTRVDGDSGRMVAAPTPAAPAHPAVASARGAQRTFERTRRQGLRFYNGGATARCDVRIGRLCYWNNNGDVPPPAERAEVATERAELLALLDRAAAAAPADDWTAGQRVRYLAEAGRHADAEQAAAACAGTGWWCAALRGLAAHGGGRHAAAAAAFDSALARMPAAERCAWRDVSLWLDDRERDAYRALACAPAAVAADDPRGAWERRFWWLAQPLWLLDGNDLRSELAARRTLVRIESQGAIPYDLSWGDDMAEIELRYGVPTAWSVTTAGALDTRAPSVIGHEPTPSFDFVPRPAALAAPLSAPADAWALGEPLPRMRYAPRYARRGFGGLPHHQVARFRRGDSALVVGAWDVERDRDWGSGAVRVALALADTTGPRHLVRRDSMPRRGAVAVLAPAVPTLLGLEVFGPAQERAGRERRGLEPLSVRAPLSDLLLLREGAGAAPTLDAVLADALGSRRVRAGGRVGLYWESYLPASPTAPAAVSLVATRLSTGRLERMRGALRVGSAARPVAVSFQDQGRPDGQPGRSLGVSWPDVPAGDYRIELTVTPAGGVPTTTELVVQVERAP